jgi:hypothetical protein
MRRLVGAEHTLGAGAGFCCCGGPCIGCAKPHRPELGTGSRACQQGVLAVE